jgi:hypothetical protein
METINIDETFPQTLRLLWVFQRLTGVYAAEDGVDLSMSGDDAFALLDTIRATLYHEAEAHNRTAGLWPKP